jgi:2-dehydro-3-deoxyphosphogluconate aldolase / (4S)-4-hydroxy-2-oxoglutarate aldolase
MSDGLAGRRPLPLQLAETGIVAILRSDREDHLAAVAVALTDAGIRCLELTMTTPGATGALRRLRPQLGDEIALGMGSVTTAEQAETALQAGADFLVSPGVCADVARAAVAAGVGCYPAGWTPTEILAAWEHGATAVKLFPAASGGPRHLRDLRGPLPHIPLIPTGGVALEQIGDYLAAGAAAVGLGGPLIGDALVGGSLTALQSRAETALSAVDEARGR